MHKLQSKDELKYIICINWGNKIKIHIPTALRIQNARRIKTSTLRKSMAVRHIQCHVRYKAYSFNEPVLVIQNRIFFQNS